ncbi:MAG TPA: YcaO-like family protein, partial [Candidatus Paceibacterota bacterium]|nr:YcaO-like family protein [Candidatus Paceibacterota bacterium]
LSASMVVDRDAIPYGDDALADLFLLAERMRSHGILRSYHLRHDMPDEPPMHYWQVRFRDAPDEGKGSGSDMRDSRHALTCALAEALERHIWYEYSDYFLLPMRKTVAEMAAYPHIAPERFTGFSDAQRSAHPRLRVTPESTFLWIQGYSWTEGRPLWLPAQTVSASATITEHGKFSEPLLRGRITTGLATHVTREEALLAGALEVIERDAYMVTWLNQLSPPRYDIDALAASYEPLAHLRAQCVRYRLQLHAVRLPTDAPAHAVLAVVEDSSGMAPRFSVGLKAHRDPRAAMYKAIIEALRARRGTRRRLTRRAKDAPVETTIGHRERLTYWAREDTAPRLSFLIAGERMPFPKEVWEDDSIAQHFERITKWCTDRAYELTSVSLTDSRANITPWHVEMVVIPELHPMHVSEQFPHHHPRRLASVPLQFGYTPLPEPFSAEPHPFS